MLDRIRQFIKPLPGCSRYFNNRCTFQKSTFQFFLDFFLNEFQPFFIDQITLVDHQNALLDPKESQNVHVFSCLRHDTFIRCHNQKYQIHSDNSRNHVVDKFFMSRNINDPYTVSIFQIKISKPEVNGDPSSLFFFPPVRVTSGKCFYQCRFPMVNVTCGSYDNVFHNNSPSISAIFLK